MQLTSFIRIHVLPRYCVLLGHLVLEVLLPLRQHFQRTSQAQDGVLGAVLLLGGVAAPEAAEAPAGHGGWLQSLPRSLATLRLVADLEGVQSVCTKQSGGAE